MSVIRTLFSLSAFLLSAVAVAQSVPYKGGSGKYNKLVWFDEFNNNGLPDSNKWSYENGYIRNRELQYYTVSRKENALVSNGYLTITALNDSLKDGSKIYPISSASLHTSGKKEVAEDWKIVKLTANSFFQSRKDRLELLTSFRLQNAITEEFFQQRLADEKEILKSELHAIAVINKVTAQNAANAAIQVLQKAVQTALGII